MPHAIIHGNNCSRHEFDFENAETAVKVLENDQNLELMAEVLKEEYPWQKSCFALFSLVRLLRLLRLLRFKFAKSVAKITSQHSIAMKVVR